MTDTAEPVLIWIPLMQDLGMSWKEIKETPNWELQGLLGAYQEFKILHSMDGYTQTDIAEMSKNKPELRSQWYTYQERQKKYRQAAGLEPKEEPKRSFKEIGRF